MGTGVADILMSKPQALVIVYGKLFIIEPFTSIIPVPEEYSDLLNVIS